jgi:hypothetical protein
MRSAILAITAVVSIHAATPLYQASVDNPQNYTVVSGAATPDAAVLHNGRKSLRVEPGKTGPAAAVRLSPVALTIGKRYEISAWVRSDKLEVRDLDRSPIATGATIAMASMPFDVHASSIGGTRDWTRLSLKFVASRSQDQILLSVGNGGGFHGTAWFEGVSLDETGAGDAWPAREAVASYGPAYRYPASGWIYLHIEGQPYERGYQHGHLMAREIPEYIARCAADLGSAEQWNEYRTMASALFLRGFDREILEEMRGIADGASDAGAKWMNRRIDLTDLVVANVTVEMGELRSAVTVTPTGLENFTFSKPAYEKKDSVLDHCSAFAATGPATRDGKMLVAHVTWWPLTLAEQTNVMLDIKPAAGHRLLMQSYPGGIESGTDWYQNDAGVVLTETTIAQTPFNAQGTPVAFRARQAIQYGGNIDEVVRYLGTRNNGLYTNEWLIGDAKNDEVAMYELGTNRTKLWRSSKNEWFGDTPGFYWGDNNAKDLAVRLELHPDPHAAGGYIPYTPMPRDLKWQELYRASKGQLDEQFAFTAFRTAPLVAASTMDAKVVTSDMAKRLMVWGEFGKPNQREWLPGGRSTYAKNDGLYPNTYYLFDGSAPAPQSAASPAKESTRRSDPRPTSYEGRLWDGWVLPASDADAWFVAGAAAYRQALASDDLEKSLEATRITYRGLKLGPQNQMTRHATAQAAGVLWLDGVRRKMGDDAFLKLMSDYFTANTTKTVTAQSFLDKAGVKFEAPEPGDGPAYLTTDIGRRLATAIIVYGTDRDAGANRYAAEQMQTRFLEQFESKVEVVKDFEATDELLRHRDVIFVGRPEANSALNAWSAKLGLKYNGASFEIAGATHASEREALLWAAKNPLDASHMALVVAGNDALRTVKAFRAQDSTAYVVYEDGAPLAARSGRRR